MFARSRGPRYHAVDEIPLRGDSTLSDGNWALLFAVEAKNVTVEGPGTIDGQGQLFRSTVPGQPPPRGLGGRNRPYHLHVCRCENLRVQNIRFVRGAFHSVRVIQRKHVHLDNVRFEVINADLRPAEMFDNVRDAAINGVSVQGNPAAESALRFTCVQDALLTAVRVLTPAMVFLQLEGPNNAGITIDGGDLSKASTPLVCKAGAMENAVKLRI